MIREFNGFDSPQSARLSRDEKKIVTTSLYNGTGDIGLWEVESGKKIYDLIGHTKGIVDFEFSPDGTLLISSSEDNIIKTWDVTTGAMRSSFGVESVGYLEDESPDDGQNIHFKSEGGRLVFYAPGSQETLITLVPIGENDWIVFHPSELFDATPNAMNSMYWLCGDEIIEFNQLKERYYEPGLWKKIMAGENCAMS